MNVELIPRAIIISIIATTLVTGIFVTTFAQAALAQVLPTEIKKSYVNDNEIQSQELLTLVSLPCYS
jgi:hypothetical protein